MVLCLRGGSLLDLDSGAVRDGDVAMTDGQVAAVGTGLAADADRVVDVSGAFVLPGFVDLHAHVFDGVGDSVSADRACLDRGTVTVVDGGTAGANTIDAFRRIAHDSRAEVLAWLNLSTIGLVDTRVGELVPGAYLDVEAAIDAARRHPGFVVGIKARLSTYAAGRGAGRVLSALRAVADEVRLPVMVHVGDTDEPLEELVTSLRPGDVVTHALTGRKHGIIDGSGRLRDGIVAAQASGVAFDAARGGNHVSFQVLAAAVAQGFLPDTLSTDMHRGMIGDPAYGMTTIGTYLLAHRVSLHETLARMTVRPARILGRHIPSMVSQGQEADLTVVRVDDRPTTLRDVDGQELRVPESLVPVGTVRAGAWSPTVVGA